MCDPFPRSRLVPVSTAAELTAALARALPGDLIRLADGVYTGSWTITANGTPEKPITICGGSQALLDAASMQERDVITLKASYWVMTGFSITGGLRGIYTERASHNVLDKLEIYGIGQEAVHWRVFSSHNVLRNSRIHDTGLVIAEFGEGVYIGQYRGHWCGSTGCQPDRSDSNQVLDNVIGPNVTAEHVDVKEGTTGGVISGNRFDGEGMPQPQDWIDSWVEINGSGYTVSNNQGTRSPRDGFQVIVGLNGWGNDNVFTGNVADVRGPGFGFRIDTRGTRGNRIACDNQVLEAQAGFSNVPCS
ncbi:MAG TPA: right-handed parallel beta-helix repeat-containing protein [Gemmatimonadales bacterium]